jgi:hypothetical protein
MYRSQRLAENHYVFVLVMSRPFSASVEGGGCTDQSLGTDIFKSGVCALATNYLLLQTYLQTDGVPGWDDSVGGISGRVMTLDLLKICTVVFEKQRNTYPKMRCHNSSANVRVMLLGLLLFHDLFETRHSENT